MLSTQIPGAGARVICVDSSADMAAAARERGLDARIVDAHARFCARDAVVSKRGPALMREPDRVIESVRWVLCPGGRFVGEMGGEGNVAAAQAARSINRDSNTPGSSLIRLSSFRIRLFFRPASPAGWTSLARQFLRPSAGGTQ